MIITKELLEKKVAEAIKKRDAHITAVNGSIAEINAYVALIAEFDKSDSTDDVENNPEVE
jgi:hypothetical protein